MLSKNSVSEVSAWIVMYYFAKVSWGDEQNFNESIVCFIGETLRGKVSKEKFDELLAIRQSFVLYGNSSLNIRLLHN